MKNWVPYCGAPPAPLEIWSRWNFDPWLIGALGLLALLWIGGGQRTARQHTTFWAAFVITALAFVSPLCALSMALFSARVAQHLILTLVAAPLFAAAIPFSKGPRSGWIIGSAGLFAALFWFWHLPIPYAATLSADVLYWAMHLSLLGSAVLCWRGLIRFRGDDIAAALGAAALSAVQMSLYSGLLFFSRAPWHSWHEHAALPWGLDGLADQQLAALLMWVPGSLLFLLTMLVIGAQLFHRLGDVDSSNA